MSLDRICIQMLCSWAGEVITRMKCTIIYSSNNAGVDYYNTGFYQNETVDEYFRKGSSREK